VKSATNSHLLFNAIAFIANIDVSRNESFRDEIFGDEIFGDEFLGDEQR